MENRRRSDTKMEQYGIGVKILSPKSNKNFYRENFCLAAPY